MQRRIFRQHNRMSQVYQMLRAYVLLKRDVDYVVTDAAIVLIDELTGRTLPDNRYQQGLHATLEAKEGVPVHPECETLAQVSVQGFINQYSHVAGMTGTALDSRDELERQYGLRVVPVPPSQPPMRVDFGARLYLSRRDKLAAIVDEVKACQRVGRPVLVGTLTIEQSEELSRLFSRHGIEHNLLNAVRNTAEAEIIRGAGAFGAVTISTNMAGRGTDIVLEPGVNGRVIEGYLDSLWELLDQGWSTVEIACGTTQEAELLRKAVSNRQGLRVRANSRAMWPYASVLDVSRKSGEATGGQSVTLDFGLGLYVLGAEMNQVGRIDRQLRGRSGRQGAPGASRFILSLEDRLMDFQGDNSSCLSDGPHLDGSGRTFFEGPKLERHLASVQAGLESDDEASRSMSHQYSRVLEAETTAYYTGRREIMEMDSFDEACRGFAEGWAARVVARYFPVSELHHYSGQFDEMAEELWVDFGVDCSSLHGVGIDTLAEEIGHLLLDTQGQLRAKLGDTQFARLEKFLFLHTADELWRDRIADLQELLLSVPLAHHNFKLAVADYAIRSFDGHGPFKNGVVGAFLSRLLTFPVESVAEDQGESVSLVEDLAEILV